MPHESIRNVAIIAHVDHGKTTLVDHLLMQSGMFRAGELDKLAGGQHNLIMDSNPLERERGITILSKNCAVDYQRTTKLDNPSGTGVSPVNKTSGTGVPPVNKTSGTGVPPVNKTSGTGVSPVQSRLGEPCHPDPSGTGSPLADEPLIRINIIDTPGHADFGGEVERVLRMADGAILVVDAFEGPMPQTRFVVSKALEAGLTFIVVVNKCDRPDARPHQVADEALGLFIDLGADDHALEFPVLYASARSGWAGETPEKPGPDLRPILDAIVDHIPAPGGDPVAPMQMLITTLDYSEYLGRIGIGRVYQGTLRKGERIARIDRDGDRTFTTISGLWRFQGLGRIEVDSVAAGDLCAVVCGERVEIGDTLSDPDRPAALTPVTIDEPTLSMTFRVNDSPFAGREGKFVTSRQLRDRLTLELQKNVALRVAPGETMDEFVVSGRGLLHLGVLIETMRREGYELAVGKPEVVTKIVDGRIHEPIERLVIDCPTQHLGSVMELVGGRRGELRHMEPRGADRTHLVFDIAARGLIGLRSRVLTATQGHAIMHHTFDRYAPMVGELPGRGAGVIIATESGRATAYAIEGLSDRGIMFVIPGEDIYAGQVVGEHNRENDIVANVVRLKHLTNIRSATKEAFVTLKAPRRLSLEAALEYIEGDELVEITPDSIRLRKRVLDEAQRRKSDRAKRDRERAVTP